MGDGLSASRGSAVIPNRARIIIRVFQIGLAASFPPIAWFGFVVLDSMIAVIIFVMLWIFGLIAAQYVPNQPLEISFSDLEFTVLFRQGVKSVNYGALIRIVWRTGATGGGISLWTRNDDVIRLAAIDRRLTDEVLRRIGAARPDLESAISESGFPTQGGGIAEDEEHRGQAWRWTWGDTRNHEHLYWGARPKKLDSASQTANRKKLDGFNRLP